MDLGIAGRWALVCAASKGLGKGCAQALVREGVHVVVTARGRETLEATAAELRALNPGVEVRAVAGDITTPEGRAAALAAAPQLDILVNNAGANLGKASVGEADLATFAAMLDLNCTAQLALTQPVWRAMARTGGGRVVNVVSSAARFSVAGIAGYTASKTALDGRTGVMRREGKPLGIHVTAVYPGGIDTPFRAQARADYLRPETVAEAIVGLLRLPDEAAAHELVLRPPVEDNFA